jgi:hypothetical protein
VAAAQSTDGAEVVQAHIRGTVHDDGAVPGAIVHAGLETVEAQRVAVAADVGISRAKEPEARLVAPLRVREPRREIVAAAAPVRDELFEENLLALEIEDL